ncbi:MAG: hypothetical protein ACJ74S_05070 [Gaiellaceae bacterium]
MTETRIDELLDQHVPPFESRSDGWADVLGRARRSLRRYALAVAVVLAIVVVPTGIALGGEISSLFRGTPAPPPVSTSFEAGNRVADMATQKGFGDRFPHVDVSRAHGVLEIQTIYGPQDVWAAPNDQGGTCWFVDFANDPAPNGSQPGSGTCDTGEHDRSIAPSIGWELPHPDVSTLFGLVDVQADRVVVVLKDGSIHTLPVDEGAFLASLDKGAQLDRITAYDGDDQVATFEPPAD